MAALHSRLKMLGPEQLTGFADRLHEVLDRLDTPAHAAACHGIGDAFLYMRCAVVLSGRTTFGNVALHPPAMAAFDGCEAERLLDAAARAYEKSTGLPWEHDPAAFSDEEPYSRWLDISFHSEDPWATNLGLEYELTYADLIDDLCHSAIWTSWWQGSGRDELIADVYLGSTRPVAARRGRRIVKLTLHWTTLGSHSSLGASQSRQAYDDVLTVLTTAQQTLDLPQLPELPNPAPPDPDYVEQQRRARL
ncbi:DUF4240 domain-containing protein [Actinoplanes sp. URMC 104]|uniref:DUF4240 domain-containing protein n=1 Tax=Actinoplanes sp. URMC 104 TaxID=3423409 RepID=UPI003F1AF433